MNKLSEKSLHDYMMEMPFADPLDMEDDEFTAWARTLPLKILKEFMDTLRDHKNFYKKILEEDRRKEKPASVRYIDAQKKVDIVNVKGKILKTIFDNLNS